MLGGIHAGDHSSGGRALDADEAAEGDLVAA
jgi:hypothetical protein